MRRSARSLSIKIAFAFLVTGLLAGGSVEHSLAHPLGNFTVNQYARIEITATGPRIVYVLDMAEVPALQEIQKIDLNGDGEVDQQEADAYLSTELPVIARALQFSVGSETLSLRAEQPQLTFPEGQAGLKLLRLRTVFVPMAPNLWTTGDQEVSLRNTFQTDRIGWREMLVTHGADVVVVGIEVPATDLSRELTSYPADLLRSPLDQQEIAFSVRQAPGEVAAAGFTEFSTNVPAVATTSRPNGGATGARFASLLNGDDLTRTGVVLALLAAMLWGAAHALSPGHGKTVVGAYLVGSRGTPRHAVFLGLTVTITHTAGVVALGLLTLFASHYIVPETLFPWLSVLSGALVIAMGLWTLQMRLRNPGAAFDHHHHDHDHEHDHEHPHDHDHDGGHVHGHGGHTHSHVPPAAITWRGLLALGVSGGLIPCPSALLVLLGAVALGKVGFGLALVVAFSLGLAATLTSLGLLFLYAGRLLEKRIQPGGRFQTVLRFAPAVGSVALTLAGVAIIVRALGETSLR